MKTFTTYAAKAKQFLNLLQGYTKGIRLTAILILLLMGVSNAWAGDPYISGFGLQFRDDGGTWFKTGTKGGDGIMDLDLGSKTNLKIVYIYANGNKNGGNLCDKNYFKYAISGTTQTENWGGTRHSNVDWNTPTYKWGKENSQNAFIDLVQNRKPGNYSMEFIFSVEGNSQSGICGNWYDCKYSNGNWKFTWSIPDPTITITGASALVVGISTNIKASMSNYPIGSTISKIQVSGNTTSKSATGSTDNLTVSSVTPNASGKNGIKVTVTVTFGTGGTKDYVYDYNVTPPAVNNFKVTPDNVVSGIGTSAEPYIITYGKNMTLTVSGGQATTDANSTLHASFGDNSHYSAALTKAYTPTTEKKNVAVYARYYNSTASLSGTESSETIYYRSEQVYTVTFNANGHGTAPAAQTISEGGKASQPAAPTATGYTFGGWYKESNCTNAFDFNTAINANITLYAKWVERDLIVNADWGWYESMDKNQKVYTYTKSNLASGLHSFKFLESDKETAYDYDDVQKPTGTYANGELEVTALNPGAADNNIAFTLDRKSDVTITLTLQSANDNPQPTVNIAAIPYYNITLDQANATSQSNPTSVEVKWNEAMPKLTTTPERTGYNFRGYYVNINDEDTKYYNAEGTSAKKWNIDTDKTLYAKWEAIPYEITYELNGGTNADNPTTYTIVTPDITLKAAGKMGYTFLGWYDNAEFEGNPITSIPTGSTENKDLYAKWEERKLILNHDFWGWQNWEMHHDGAPEVYYTSDPVKIPAGTYHFQFLEYDLQTRAYGFNDVTSTDKGLSFSKTDGQETIQFSFTRKSDITITLTLQSDDDSTKPTVRIDATPYYKITLDQTGCAQPGTQKVEVKSGNAMPEILLPGDPTGYNFGGYYDQKDGAGKKYYNADGTSANTWDKNDDGTLYAQWTPTNYTITYNLNGGSGTMTPTSYTIESETFALPTPTKTGYTFAGWYANAELTGEAVTQIEKGSTGNKAYWAKWTTASYNITFDQEEGHGGTTTVTVPFGAQLPDITIPTKAGHLFLGYYDGDNGRGTQYYDANGKGLKTMPANNLILHAKWLNSSDCIFFYNDLGWSDVYVYFYSSDKYWDDSKGTGSQKERIFEIKDSEGNVTDAQHKPHYREYRGQMTKIEGTSIWYYNRSVHSEITRDNYTTVAFTEYQRYDYEFFNNTEVVRRGDFNANVPMFVSMKKDARIMNQNGANKSTYYNYGYWVNYPTNTGYKLHIFDESGNKISDQLVDIPFEYGDNMIMPWSVNVSLEGAMTYAFKIQRADDVWYGNNGTMTTNSSGDVGQTAWEFTTGTDNCKITTTAPGTYVFTLNYGKDAHSNYNYLVGVKYHASVGDYRLAYKDNAHPFHPGHLLKKRAGKDTVSFFVHYNESPVIMLQKVTNIDENTGAITWTTQKTYALTANQAGSEYPGQAMMPGRRMANEVILHIGGESLDGVDLTGIYNFVLEQTADEATLQGSATKYDGDFYIRTNSAIGGWGDFRQAGNKMTYSSYAENHSDFNHYFVEWINAGTNVKFTIANDYSYCISDTLDADNIIQKYGVSQGCLPANANVRFGWDSRNNKLTRAYIAGSGFVGDRFLVVTGNDLLKDADGYILDAGPQGNTDEDKKDPRYKLNANEDIFKDLGNWVYQVDVTAQNGTMINLTALYNGTIQYFKGAEGDPSYPLLASTNLGKEYKIRMIYNFKTNHLVVAWMPESPYDVQGAEQLGTDMLLIRSNQGQATQIQLNSGAETINNIKTAYAVMTFTKTFVEDDKKPIHERKHYWVSFPFDVKISDVFGFSEYKDHWIMQAYDGAGRAANGLWADTDTYWRYITNNNFVMRKGQGYLLTLDVKKMLELDPVFANTEEVSLYFPSRGELKTITSDLPIAATVPAHTCTIERENRKIYDSHWNMIGVPGFADIANFNTDAPDKYLQELEYQGDSLSFYYAYIPAENSYEVRTGETTFQSMYSYMVQFAGTINWTTPEVEYNPQLAARRNSNSNEPEKLTMRLEIAQGEEMADQTFVQLQQEGATPEFDMNLDLTKIINSGANIYTLVGNDRIQTAGNALPMDEAMVVPVGVKIDAEGEYTFRMPDGTEGMVVELVDYETNTRTNLLLSDYIVTLPKGTSENRFALHIQPQKDVVTSLENIGEGVNNGEAVNKYLIDGKLIIRTADGVVYDAQGKRL